MPPVKLGTRASALARWQAEWVAMQLRRGGGEVELVPIVTAGDRQQIDAIKDIGGQGVFTKEIQRALLDGRIDVAVHSLKDLPTDGSPELLLAAVPERGPASDVLVWHRGGGLLDLPNGARVGTGSLRRRAQLLHYRPDLQVEDVRGNVETRLKKLERGDFDAMVLAEAGLRRLGLEEHINCVLPHSQMLPAVGQGALAVEIRVEDEVAAGLVAGLDHGPTHAAVLAERAMLLMLQGGCQAPIAGLAIVREGVLTLSGRVISRDGVEMIEAAESVEFVVSGEAGSRLGESRKEISRLLGRRVAERLIVQGAKRLICR